MSARGLSDAERRDWLRLSRTDGVGPVAFAGLLARFGTATHALERLPELSRRAGRGAPMSPPSPDAAQAELDRGAALGARLLAACEPEFPPMLAALDPAPPLIWVRGDPGLLSRSCVAIVGARIASAAGQRFARGLAKELGEAGQVVVSGLARGIDGAAHEGALPTGTAAVLGGGVDDVYPPEHADLYARIVERGCIVSESPVGHTAKARDFPRRNRLIAGLSRAIVVVEAELRSGSLITARLAAEQGREVLSVPGSPLDPRAKGTNDLIRQGAALCEGAEDVLRALSGLRTLLREPQGDLFSWRDAEPEEPEVDAARDCIEALLTAAPVSRDELARLAGVPAPVAFAALVELELVGKARLLPGGTACRA